jgi:uncharacterized membrane protein YhaH (DUF805 family)
MDFTYLFTSLQGRVNRAKWWAGEAVLFLVFSATAFLGNQTTMGPVISALIWIVLYLPAYPLAAKRFQDRNRPGETALYGYVPSIIAAGLLSFGPVEAPGAAKMHCEVHHEASYLQRRNDIAGG